MAEKRIINNCLKRISTDILLGEVLFKFRIISKFMEIYKIIKRILRFNGEFLIIKKWVPIISGEG